MAENRSYSYLKRILELPNEDKIVDKPRKEDLATLLTIIIESTTIVPFRWHQTNKYKCFYCQTLFTESSQLKRHTTLKHKEIDMEKIISGIQSRKQKVKIDVANIWCSKCDTQFEEFLEYFDHLPVIHGVFLNEKVAQSFECYRLSDRGMKCMECGQKFRFFLSLLKHTTKNHTEHFLCEICGASFADKVSVDTHVKQVHAVKNCKYCDLTFTTQYSLVNHMQNVHTTEKLKCSFCPEILRSMYLKKRHMAVVHNYKKFQYVCEVCSKIFVRYNKFVEHKMRVHYKIKNFACEVCGYKSFKEEDLKRHMVRHDTTKRLKCAVCDSMFRRKKNLVSHMKSHNMVSISNVSA